MPPDRLRSRLGLNVPEGWWPAAQLVKSFEAAGFGWVQVPSPPAEVLADPRACAAHARAAAAALDSTTLRAVIHGPGHLTAGTGEAARPLEGLLAYAADAGAATVVYHGRNFPDSAASEDRALAETRSLARLASRAERLGVKIAVENLAPLYRGPEMLGHTPLTLRSLIRRISSPALGLCLDLGHAHVVADLRRTGATALVGPVLDSVVLFHVHDNLGARGSGPAPAEVDPLKLDLHLAPGRGTVPWGALSPLLARSEAPLMLEVHPPHRPHPALLFDSAALLTGQARQPVAA